MENEDPARALLPDARDRLAFQELQKVVAGGAALALVGAGLSVKAGYAGWERLLELMDAELTAGPWGRGSAGASQALPMDLRSMKDLLWRAETYRTLLTEPRYRSLLMQQYAKAPGSPPCADNLVRLPFRHIFTTNYDASLERAHHRVWPAKPYHRVVWGNEPEVLELMRQFSDEGYERRYVHLHGAIDLPDSLVLTDSDYKRRYMSDDRTTKKMFAIFAMHRVAFFGFGMEDPDLMTILRQVHALGYTEPRHFAVIGIEEGQDRKLHRERLRVKYGIEPIFYDKRDHHAALDGILELLARLAAPIAPPDSAMLIDVDAFPGVAPPREGSLKPPVVRRPAAAPLPFPVPSTPSTPARAPAPAAGGASAPAPGPSSPPARRDPEDPQKGQWGGLPERDGRRLSAVVTPDPEDSEWFDAVLTVESTDPVRPLKGPVVFHVHDTFPKSRYSASVGTDGRATLSLSCWGAFTVGAEADGGATHLELDLAELEEAPRKFRSR